MLQKILFGKVYSRRCENARKHIYGMGKEDKKDYIHSFISLYESEDGKVKRKFNYEGNSLCSRAFMTLFGVSHNLVYSAVSKEIRDKSSPKEDIVTSFLIQLSNLHDFMPDRDEIHLSYNSHKLVYEEFKKYLEGIEDIDKNISYSYFNKVWRKMSYIKARKAIRFSKCGNV